MRITNKMLSDSLLSDMQTNLANLQKVEQQMSSQNNFSKPSDDPSGVATAMQMHSAINANTQYGKNITNTKNWMQSTDTSLGQIDNIYLKIRNDLIKSGDAPYGSDDRAKLKDEVNKYISSISEILNSNSQGDYMFGGTKGSSKPTGVEDNYIVSKSNESSANLSISGTPDSTCPSSTMYKIEVASVDGSGNITGVNCQKSSDGGGTWASVTLAVAPTATSPNVIKMDGLDLKLNPNLNTKANDTYTFSLVKNTQLTYNSSDGQSLENIPSVVSSGFTASNWVGGNIKFNVNGSNTDSTITLDSTITSSSTIDDVVENINKQITLSPDLSGKVLAQKTSDNKIKFVTLTNDTVFMKSSTVTSDLSISDPEQIPSIQLDQIRSARKTEISQGVLVQYNVSASDVINYGNGTKDNIIDLFKRIINHLDGKDDTGVIKTDAANKALTNDDLKDLDAATSQLLKVRSDVGSVENSMTSAQDRNTGSSTDMKDILSKVEKIDITQTTIELATAQTVYLAALQTSAKVIQPTLMDYMR